MSVAHHTFIHHRHQRSAIIMENVHTHTHGKRLIRLCCLDCAIVHRFHHRLLCSDWVRTENQTRIRTHFYQRFRWLCACAVVTVDFRLISCYQLLETSGNNTMTKWEKTPIFLNRIGYFSIWNCQFIEYEQRWKIRAANRIHIRNDECNLTWIQPHCTARQLIPTIERNYWN